MEASSDSGVSLLRCTTQPLERPGSSVDSRIFRNVLGHYPTGVAIITTTSGNGSPIGLTVNSFASVSLEPALVLWSLARKSASLAAFEQAGCFAIHFLSEEQKDIAQRFASRVENRFSGLDISSGTTGAPLIQDCPVRIECITADILDGGDHRIFLGEVINLEQLDGNISPLVFHRGSFARLQ